MENRARRMRRLLDVLHQLNRIEEQRKIELQRRYDELEMSQHEVIRALDTDDALHGMFVDTTARFLKSLAGEAQRVAEARDEHSQRLLEQTVKMKTAERLKRTLDRRASSSRKERELNDIIERYSGRGSASLP